MPIVVLKFFALSLCGISLIGQTNRRKNSREHPRDCANYNLFSSTIAAQVYASCNACEETNLLLVRGILKPRLHSLRSDKGTSIFPTCFPDFLSWSHSPISKCCICSTEIAFIITVLEGVNNFQEDWFGKGDFCWKFLAGQYHFYKTKKDYCQTSEMEYPS